MNPSSIYPCGRINRRGFITQAGGGFFGAALGAMWAQEGKIQGAHIGPHLKPKAKSVIFLFMCGGISHIDTFDPKDNKYAGKLIDALGCGTDEVVLLAGSRGGKAAALRGHQAVIRNPSSCPAKPSTAGERERQMLVLDDMSCEFRDGYVIHSDIAARSQAYDLAARMQ